MPVAVIVPLTLLQAADVDVAVTVGAGELAIVTVAVLIQPLASLTVTVYMLGVRLVNTLLAWKVFPLMLYCNGAVPPEPKAVIVPLPLPQVAEAGIAVINGLGELVMETTTALVQPVASFTVSV